MQAGGLRERIRVERRGLGVDGHTVGPYATLFAGVLLWAKIRPSSARSDRVLGSRLEGVNVFDVYLRQDEFSRQITADDRLIWIRASDELVMQVRGNPVDPDGRGAELHILAESGVTT